MHLSLGCKINSEARVSYLGVITQLKPLMCYLDRICLPWFDDTHFYGGLLRRLIRGPRSIRLVPQQLRCFTLAFAHYFKLISQPVPPILFPPLHILCNKLLLSAAKSALLTNPLVESAAECLVLAHAFPAIALQFSLKSHLRRLFQIHYVF